jgi:hypothetical protein
MKRAVIAALAILALSRAANAAPFDLYLQGKYDAAIAAGLAQRNAPGYALAARAELAADTMRATPCLECIRRAEDDARKAIAADPKSADGHVFLAAALGREGRLIGVLAVISQGYATQAKNHLDAALAADPSDAFAWAALAAWNIEIVHKAGARIARIGYGATKAEGYADFDKAFALAPDNIALRYQYALTLSAFNTPYFRKKIEDAFARVQNGTPHGAYELFIQARAKELRASLERGDMTAYGALVGRDQGNPQ